MFTLFRLVNFLYYLSIRICLVLLDNSKYTLYNDCVRACVQ